MRVRAALTMIALVMAGCASRPKEVAAPPTAIPPPAPVPMPLPPGGAAAGLKVPQRQADGSFVTPNTGVSAQGAVWHLRAALNVAVLGCPDPDGMLATAYNRFLNAQRTGLAAAHRSLVAEHASTAAFDTAMTRLYNYYAQPPVAAAFCAVATPMLTQAAALPSGGVTSFAATALPMIDAPFIDFYSRYDQYRVELAAWRAGQPSPVIRLAYDPAVLAGQDMVTGGAVRTATR